MYTTKRCFVMGMSTPAPQMEVRYLVTANGLTGGGFRAHFSQNKICILDFAFKSNSNDEVFEREIFKEVFEGLLNVEKLPIYFNANVLTESTKMYLKEMGATEAIEVDHAWSAAKVVNVIKIEVK